ncbi:succinate--CoA ligase subunit beta [Roseovarius sp. D22-M7]|uniref:succinate--CoA ligase subunit beta n=1 Tax=Roseovarius sp. D22-M7 TaxID=3127116 RepID=UPI0030101D8F
MMLSENQSKELLCQYGVSIPEGRLAHTPDEAERLCKEIDARKYVVKAQITAGGRGLAGGIKFAATPSAVANEARALLNSTLVTDQTAASGEKVRSVYVEAAVDIANSYYIAISFDPGSGRPMLLASASGGVEFEQLARMDESTVKSHILDDTPEARDALTAFLKDVGIEGPEALDTIENARKAFCDNDLTLVEINPFVRTRDGKWMAVDAKLALDRNASFRRPEFDSMITDPGTSSDETEAQKYNINLVQLTGNIGVVTNGAGLGLATNDMITDAGGKPANFMDIRTTARSFDIARGVEMLLTDAQVQVLLLNIHGGGMTAADTVAEGVNFAYSRAKRKLPVVAHIAGHNAEWGTNILRDRKVPVETFDTMSGAINRVVEIAKTGRAR